MCLVQWGQWCSQGQPSPPGVRSKQLINCFRQTERSHWITSTLFTWKIPVLRFILFGWFSVLPWCHSTHIVLQVLSTYLFRTIFIKGAFQNRSNRGQITSIPWITHHTYDYLPAFQTGFEMTLWKYTCKLLFFYPQIKQGPYIRSSVTL